METVIVVGPRPTEAPEGWEIYNAPRPLYGTIRKTPEKWYPALTWTGEFVSGLFYAAVDPNDPDADRWRKENESLHAFRLDYITHDEWFYRLALHMDEVAKEAGVDVDEVTIEDAELSYREKHRVVVTPDPRKPIPQEY